MCRWPQARSPAATLIALALVIVRAAPQCSARGDCDSCTAPLAPADLCSWCSLVSNLDDVGSCVASQSPSSCVGDGAGGILFPGGAQVSLDGDLTRATNGNANCPIGAAGVGTPYALTCALKSDCGSCAALSYCQWVTASAAANVTSGACLTFSTSAASGAKLPAGPQAYIYPCDCTRSCGAGAAGVLPSAALSAGALAAIFIGALLFVAALASVLLLTSCCCRAAKSAPPLQQPETVLAVNAGGRAGEGGSSSALSTSATGAAPPRVMMPRLVPPAGVKPLPQLRSPTAHGASRLPARAGGGGGGATFSLAPLGSAAQTPSKVVGGGSGAPTKRQSLAPDSSASRLSMYATRV